MPVLTFHTANETVRLEAGQIFSCHPKINYIDAPDEHLEAVCRAIEAGQPWRAAVERQFASWHRWLYDIITHPDRDLFYRRLALAPEDVVLDAGSGWGQIAIPMAHRNPVCTVEPKPGKIRFQRAVARQEGVDGNLWFLNTDYHNVEFEARFALVVVNGVLEWVGAFAASAGPRSAQRRFLQKARRELAPQGRCVIGIENRLGLKYLLGAPDDHNGASMISVFDAALARDKFQRHAGRELRVFTYTLAEYEQLLRDAGFSRIEFFAALPDYKLPKIVLPLADPAALNRFFAEDHYVPEHSGVDGSLLPFQEELRSLYRSLAQLGIAQYFVPSFYILASGHATDARS
jgi:SAM-dependent methyltransferase